MPIRQKYLPRSICPPCMAETPIHRAIWDYRFTSVCRVHSCCLIDRYPGCGRLFDWSETDLTRCGRREVTDLTCIPYTAIEEEDRVVMAAIQGYLGDPQYDKASRWLRSREPLQDVVPTDGTDLILHLGLLQLDEQVWLAATGAKPVHQSDHLQILCWGMALLDPWPEAFVDMFRLLWPSASGPVRKDPWPETAAFREWLTRIGPEHGKAVREVLDGYMAQKC